MLLYHGTKAKKLQAILKNGLKPRGKKGKGNWKHSVDSHPDVIYLTNAYAIYFAWSASEPSKDDMLVLEIDTEKLDHSNLIPDEDFLEQTSRKDGPAPIGKSMKYRTAWYRRRLKSFSHYWTDSIDRLGNCGHYGPIPPEAITRYAVISKDRAFELIMQGMDPMITLLNYHIMGEKYRNWVHWAFDDELEGETDGPFASAYMHKINRDGIDVVTL